jgi:polysaccharide biosynthesis PFTS motif protein
MLKIPFVTEWLELRNRRRLLSIMRGYRRLKETNQLGKIAEVRDALTNCRLGIDDARVSTLIFGAGATSAELILRQYLLSRAVGGGAGGVALNKRFLHSIGRPEATVAYHLPPEWRKVLVERGVRVDEFRSALAWNAFIFLCFCYGVWSVGKNSLACVREFGRPLSPSLGRSAFFAGLSAKNLPQPGQDGRSHDIVTWYHQWSGRVDELDSICHDVQNATPGSVGGIPVLSVPSAIPAFRRLRPLIRYLGWGAAASVLALIDLFRGRWWHPLLLRQAAVAGMVRIHEADALAREYLFHNGDWAYRPLWTYEAEKKGARITFYFYSTNCEEFKRPEGYPVQGHSWQAMSWPHYLVWDEYQADFVRRSVGNDPNISVVGPIWFQTTGLEMPELPLGCVAVFDVQPFRASWYQVLGAPSEYFTPRTANRFLQDIHLVVRDRAGTMALKRKRHIAKHLGRLVHVEYRVLIETLKEQKEVVILDPDLSAFRVIENCAAVISMPFTSTALLGRELGKPSIFYDPIGVVEKDDRAAHGIPIVSGIAELREWFGNQESLPAAESGLGSGLGIDTQMAGLRSRPRSG